MKKHRKLLEILLTAALILGALPQISAKAVTGAGEISFTLTPNAAVTAYSFTGVDVGATSVGYSAVNMSFPGELQLNFKGTALSSSNKPAYWTMTMSTGTGGTTNVSIIISAPAANGMETNLENFFNASTFTLKTGSVYPPAGSEVTVMISEQTIIKFTDMFGGTHAYEFVEYKQQADTRKLTWLEAYNAARGRAFAGEQGHLATLTSIDEQMFVYNTIAQKPGWLGGTRLRFMPGGNTMIDGSADISTNSDDYAYYNISAANVWYWADGPEAGTVFYNRPKRDDANGPVPGEFNFFSNRWTYDTYPQYRNQIKDGREPDGYNNEECCVQFAWEGKASWNDLAYDSGVVEGYYVEYDFPEGLSASSGVTSAEILVPLTVVFDICNSDYTGILADQTLWPGGTANKPSAPETGHLYTDYGNKVFLGWFENQADTTPFDFSTPITKSNTQNNVKRLYGKWEQYFNVSFDINNASYIGGIPTQTVVSGGRPTAPLGLVIGTVYGAWNGQQFGNREFLGWFRPGQDPSNGTPYNFDIDTVTADIRLRAEWRQYFNVTFEVKNAAYTGAPLINPQSIPDGNTAVAPDELTEGALYQAYGNKKFLGWYNGETKFDFSMPITADTTLTARWEQYYTVAFANTRGHGVPVQTIAKGGTAAAPDTSAWGDQAFTFYGWSANSASDYTSFIPFDFSASVNSDIVLYGMWDPVIYSLTFDPNGGNWSGDIEPRMHEYCPGADAPPWEGYDPSHVPPDPSLPGYSFGGWKDVSNTAPPDEAGNIFANNIYYAQWVPEIYYIVYELYGGTLAAGNPASYTVEDSLFPISISDPEREGYTFLGWMVEYSGPSPHSATGPVTGFSILQGVTGDIRLEALWAGNEYAIYYDMDGGVCTPGNPFCYTVGKTLIINPPVKLGYVFLGWTATGGIIIDVPDPNFSVPLGTTGDLYLVAFWSDPIAYNITYNLAGGANGAGNPSSYTVNDMFSLARPAKQGYTFLGWTAAGGLTMILPALDLSVSEGTTGDLSFSAHWRKVPRKEGTTPGQTPAPPAGGLPQTGDAGLPAVIFFLSGFSLFGMLIILRYIRRGFHQ